MSGKASISPFALEIDLRTLRKAIREVCKAHTSAAQKRPKSLVIGLSTHATGKPLVEISTELSAFVVVGKAFLPQ